MKQKRKILLLCMVLAANAAFCQYRSSINKMQKDSLNATAVFTKGLSNQLLPANFSATQLGFFCKKELKLEAATKVPLKFRLGNIQYCDWLEGKKSAGILPASH